MKSEYTVNIFGREMTISSDECVEHVRAVEDLVNGQLAQTAEDSDIPLQSALMVASLKLANALVKERGQHAQLKEKIRSRSNALLQKLDAKFAH